MGGALVSSAEGSGSSSRVAGAARGRGQQKQWSRRSGPVHLHRREPVGDPGGGDRRCPTQLIRPITVLVGQAVDPKMLGSERSRPVSVIRGDPARSGPTGRWVCRLSTPDQQVGPTVARDVGDRLDMGEAVWKSTPLSQGLPSHRLGQSSRSWTIDRSVQAPQEPGLVVDVALPVATQQ